MSKTVWEDPVVYYIIEKVHKTPYVWDPDHSLYKSKQKKKHFWMKMVEKINKKFNPQVEIKYNELLRKWNNLKSYYTVEKQKVDKVINSGADEIEVDKAKNNWKFREHLTFLPDDEKKPSRRKSTKNVEVPPIPSSEEMPHVVDCEPDINSSVMKCELMSPIHHSNGYCHSNVDLDESRNVTSHSLFDQTLSMTNMQPKQQPLMHGIENAAVAVFGACVASEINKLETDLQIKAKKEIFSILMDLQSEQLSRKPKRSTNSISNENEE